MRRVAVPLLLAGLCVPRAVWSQPPDFRTFRATVEPILLQPRPGNSVGPGGSCFVCHTRVTSRLKLQPLPPGAIGWTEEQSRKNYAAVLRLVVPGDPLKSRLLLHPLSAEAGGDPSHAGGKHWTSPEAGEFQTIAAWVRTGSASAPPPPVTLDYEAFRTRIQPILLTKRPGAARCVTCHARANNFLQVLAPASAAWTEEQSRKNFEAITARMLVVPGDPLSSRLLMMPLAHEAGGDPFHPGGKHWESPNDPEWQTMAAWVSLTLTGAQAPTAPPVPTLSCAAMEAFLKTAKMGRQQSIPVGVTLPSRAPLDDGKLRHDAAIQTVDVSKTMHQTRRGTELNFRDSWQFNVAGYELAKLLELNMVPPYVERKVSGVRASLSWWVSDAMMERDRFQKKITPPDMGRWFQEMSAARVFHELIADSDFNMTNMLITKEWRVWMIDFSRAFRQTKALQKPDELTKIDRKLLANLRGLRGEVLQQRLGRWLNRQEIEGVLARRDLIVRLFDSEVATKGEAAVLYDLPRSSEPCGAGLQ